MKKLFLSLLILLSLIILPAIGQAKPNPKKEPSKKPQAEFDKLYKPATALYEEQKYKEALEGYKKSLALADIKSDDKSFALYYSACCWANLKDNKKALDFLRQSIKNGFDDVDQITNEPAFSSLKEDKEFTKITKELPVYKLNDPAGIKVEKIGLVEKSPGGDKWENAYELQSAHFIVQIDVPETDGIKVVQNLEYLLEVMCKIFRLDIKKWGGKKSCFLFKDIKKFEDVRDKINGPKFAVHGWANDKELYCFVLGRGYCGLYQTYLHEICHMVFTALLSNNYSGTKPEFWVVEGIACYMGSVRLDDNNAFVLGKENNSMLKDLYKEKGGEICAMMPWSQNEFYSKRDRGAYYVLGYGICHYFFNNKDMRLKKRFGEYIKQIHLGKGSPNFFETTIGITPADLQEKLKDYISQL
jgi:tetratricopeptide (TPR) repeat protein